MAYIFKFASARTVFGFFCRLAAFSLFIVFDPFGLASMTSDASKAFVYRTLALFEPSAGAENVAVLLVDDNSASRINGERGYPLTFRQHADYLRPILCSGPATFFLDISFRGLRDDPPAQSTIPAEVQKIGTSIPSSPIDVLVNRLRERPTVRNPGCQLPKPEFYPSQATKIFTVRARSYPPSQCDPFYGHLPADCKVGNTIEKLASVATPISAGLIDQRAGTYRLAAKADDGTIEPSPALAMVLAFCDRATGTPKANLPGCRDAAYLKGLLQPTTNAESLQLVPQWSFYKATAAVADRKRFGISEKDGCLAEQWNRDASLLSKMGTISYQFWRALIAPDLSAPDQKDRRPCLPEDVISLQQAKLMDVFCGDDPNVCTDRLASFFAGRMVFYGADITGINDQFWSPVLGNVPGVAYHAVAAENLLNFGSSYQHLPGKFDSWPLPLDSGQVTDIITFAIALVLLKLLGACVVGKSNQAKDADLRQVRGSVPRAILASMTLVILILLSLSLGAARNASLPDLQTLVGIVTIAACSLLVLSFLLGFGHGAEASIAASSIYKSGEVLVLKTPVFLFIVFIAFVVIWVWHFPPINFIASALMIGEIDDD